ncbi:hypothetical protein VF14_25595 [Nostoc linckia z18]|jgi:non-haem Fe2+, alpha-ketoglutarate-dependent halogenase|uniref:Chlorinating enzyme n=2 Tax=Nostoc linckia TaxID=92942 RepID=A0A9Q5Z5Z7_NOSLI|nr:chlorinating enzyme [Nostoc linckia]PHK35295.1 hypothetical protein VF12_22695 [Nostoc linckia z15]PHK38638.1 hypothetical protein VF13_35685 [Nostoc linckia z16]PHJ62586.1 hypothetical protein VF02_16900 [Nostoc linckia z1]PHJ72022.1 hypothetical protein VF05_05575 [Nostoc linckia z3]PHJ77990.1 hypothetical protein VF03_02840 [Nostoc linckia z2]
MVTTQISSFYLTDAEKTFFNENGYVGPFKVYEPEEMKEIWKRVRVDLLDTSRAPFTNSKLNYDRHLDVSDLSKLIIKPEIVHRLQSILGQNVLCWRSEFFQKNSGDGGTGWHQVELYGVGEKNQAELMPIERYENRPIELAAWVAMTDVPREMGPLKFIPGSHKQWYFNELGDITHHPENINKDGWFYGYNYNELRLDPNWEPDKSETAVVEMKAGEVVLFTSKCVHGSLPNKARKSRVGYAIRYVPTNVIVYPNITTFTEFGETLSTEKTGCVLVAGEDKYKHNNIKTENALGESFVPLP